MKQGETVELVLGQLLCEAGNRIKHIYFPYTGVVTLVSSMDERPPVETGLIGREGMLGATLVLDVRTAPVRGVVQVPGTALCLSMTRFVSALKTQRGLRRTVSRYLYVLIAQQARAINCAHYHDVEMRLARCLLMVHDRTIGDRLQLTHSFVANMLGVQRSAITIAAGHLQQRKLISYSRGDIRVLDRRGLETASCGCYQVLSAEYLGLFPASTA